MNYHIPTPEQVEKYGELYAEIGKRDGMTIQEMRDYLGLKCVIIDTFERMGMYLWYEPETRKYRVMKYEDELMEVVR